MKYFINVARFWPDFAYQHALSRDSRSAAYTAELFWAGAFFLLLNYLAVKSSYLLSITRAIFHCSRQFHVCAEGRVLSLCDEKALRKEEHIYLTVCCVATSA